MAEPRDRGAKWPPYVIGGLLLTAVLALGAWSVELPYLAFSTGPVGDAADSVVADGVEVYPPEGELLMLTIVSQDVNIFEAMIAGVDPTIDLVRKERVRRPGESDEEYRNRVLQQMEDSNYVSIAVALDYLGFELEPSEIVINDFVEGVPAEAVLELGDTIAAIDGVEVAALEEVTPLIDGLEPGDEVELSIIREGEPMDVRVELTERDEEPGRPMIGVTLGILNEPPFPITIEEGDVGGPSAGLMHTLAVIDTLTEGELTKGHVIAGTGTIRLDGSVGNIGGIRQKVPAAEAAGADYVLVPEGNYQAALTAERSSIEIVPVATLDDAMEFFDTLEPA